jgi:hypothetical protein
VARQLVEIRILPPFVIGRLGSSPSPMDNYKLEITDPVGARAIVAAPTLVVDTSTGEATLATPPAPVRFRDEHGRIRPIAPFLEVWARFDDSDDLVPLTIQNLAEAGMNPNFVQWSVHVANHKAFRRTRDPKDRIEATLGPFSDHDRRALAGISCNFKTDKVLPLGHAQYIRPTDAVPGIRLRITPAAGKVYGPERNPHVADDVYDAARGSWKGYKDDDSDPRITIPGEIYAAEPDGSTSLGYLDDECDGIVEVKVAAHSAFARIAIGPPTFAPDSQPVRTVDDELVQALLGPNVAERVSDAEVEGIVRRVLETVKLMNTEVMNRASHSSSARGVGMARMDYLDRARAPEPIMNPSVVDALAVRARHERVLLALESGTLAWFARVLREHDAVGDLSDAGRRLMPAMMRGADGRYLALTRRQVALIRGGAAQVAAGIKLAAAPPPSSIGARLPMIAPKNRTAQLAYDAAGNPPSAHPRSAISNSYPGLEMDFRNAWKRVLEGIVLHEAANLVVEVTAAAPPEAAGLVGMWLQSVDGIPITVPVTGPLVAGAESVPLPDTTTGKPVMALEWSNALATIIPKAGQLVRCLFRAEPLNARPGPDVEIELRVQAFFVDGTAVIARDLAEPGALSQSLCSPWQNDYRECACFYWAASRPDYVNVDALPDGTSTGNNWMQKSRARGTSAVYVIDDWVDSRLYSHVDLFTRWEDLAFVIGGEDEE